MIRKHRTGTLVQVRALQLLIRRCQGLPSPPSRWIDGRWQNVCPRCGSTAVQGPPWTCSACGWTAAADPRGCCLRINRIRRRIAGGYALAIEGADATSDRLTPAQRTALAAHITAAVDVDDATELAEETDDE